MYKVNRRLKAVVLCLLLIGCSDSPKGASQATAAADSKAAGHVEVENNVAVFVFARTGRKYKLGTVTGEQVKLYNGWGGQTVTLKDLEVNLARDVVAVEEKDYKFEQLSLGYAFYSQYLIGIWVQEEVKLNGQLETLDPKKPDYLILRDDKTFRNIKKGKKTEGTWLLNSMGQLELKPKKGDTSTAQTGSGMPIAKLELTIKEGPDVSVIRFGRTDLKKEP